MKLELADAPGPDQANVVEIIVCLVIRHLQMTLLLMNARLTSCCI